MTSVTMTGCASFGADKFEFRIGPWVHGTGLIVRRVVEGQSTETGAGIWPSEDKAKSVAAEIVLRALGANVQIEWSES